MKTNKIGIVFLGGLLFSLGFLLWPHPIQAQQSAKYIPAFFSAQGCIVMWSGDETAIPDGWQLCNGANGTPDLRDRFVLGVHAGQDPGDTGGANELQLSKANMPSHSHYFHTEPVPHHEHWYDDKWNDCVTFGYGGLTYVGTFAFVSDTHDLETTGESGEHKHGGSTEDEGLGYAVDNRPSYYQLAFIMKL